MFSTIVDRYNSCEQASSDHPEHGGAVGYVQVITFNDGARCVSKVDSVLNTQREMLANAIARLMGVRVPDIMRLSEDTILMEFIDGPTLFETVHHDDSMRDRIALFDWLIQNDDRHEGNMMVDSSGRLYAIDHGFVLTDCNVDRFTRYAMTSRVKMRANEYMYIRDGILALREQFEELGERDCRPMHVDDVITLLDHYFDTNELED